MKISRRGLIGTATAAAAVGATGSLAGCSSSGSDENITLRVTWWGNDARTELTNQAIQAFQDENPNITINAENGDWSNYWDKLATQTAANDAPDVIQMDEKYLAEYSSNNMLLDLENAGVSTSEFAPGTVDTGQVDGTLYAINAGINAAVVIVNKDLLDDAGIDMPDDSTWT